MNGHVAFVAARVREQVARVLVGRKTEATGRKRNGGFRAVRWQGWHNASRLLRRAVTPKGDDLDEVIDKIDLRNLESLVGSSGFTI